MARTYVARGVLSSAPVCNFGYRVRRSPDPDHPCEVREYAARRMTARAGRAIISQMEEHAPMTMRRRLRLAFEFARSVEPRALPSRRAVLADVALAIVIVLVVHRSLNGGGNSAG